MINKFLENIRIALNNAIKELGIENPDNDIVLEVPKDQSNGDYSTNIAMRLARIARKAPVMIAKDIVEKLDKASLHLEKIEVAGAGFINFTINVDYLLEVISKVNNDETYGNNNKQKTNLAVQDWFFVLS